MLHACPMLKPAVGFRPAAHDDAPFAARVATATQPAHPQAAEELLERWVNTEHGSEVRRFIVQEDGLDVCWISMVQPGDVGGSATYLNLMVPEASKHLLPEIGTLGEAQAREMGASVLICRAQEDSDHIVEWLRSGGWTQKRRQRFWRLDLAANAHRIRELRTLSQQRLMTTGVTIRTVADLGGEAFLPSLLPVAVATFADIPTSVEYVPEPYEKWVVWMQPPAVLPERICVAVLDGRPIGYSYLAYRPSVVETGFTGVLREHRGKGLGQALKLETLVQAIDLGVPAVETDNDSENSPILHINEELGYEEMPGNLEFHRELT